MPIQHHHSRGHPAPTAITIHEGLSYRELQTLNATVEAATEADFKWMSSVLTTESQNQPPLDWSGHFRVSARHTTPVQPTTQYVFGSLIDSPPAHPDSPDDIGARREILATTGYEHYSSCGRYAAIKRCLSDQMVRSRKVERSRAAARGHTCVDVVHQLHRQADEGHGTGRPVGLRIRGCAVYNERQGMAKGIASTSHGDNFTVRRSQLQRYHRS